MEPATYGGDRVEEDPVHLRLQSARNDSFESEGAAGAEPVINLAVMPFFTWQVVKRCIKEKWPWLKAVPDMNIRLLHKSVELRNGGMVADYNMQGGDRADRPVELQYLIIDQGHEHEHKGKKCSIGLYVDSQVPCTHGLRERVHASLAALLSGIQPRLTDEGTGATYMLRDTSNRHTVAVFKPKDEEAFAPQNPRGYIGPENSTGLRHGVLSSQQAAREVAAYLLDHDKFAGVPETTLVHSKHPKFVQVRGKVVWKIGAFQAFIETKDTASNFAPQVFGTADVHRIGILDVRIVNLDRNDGNVLVKHGRGSQRYELVPIDHGLSMPDRLEVYTDDIAWMSWPQAQKPFGQKELEYIRTLNGARDARLLAKCLGVRRDCLRLTEVTTRLLQIGAEFGLTLFEIGTIMYREDRGSDFPTQPSKLEQVIQTCLDSALAVAGDGTAAGATSATLMGLDLQSCTRSLGAGRLVRQVSGGDADIRTTLMTPQLRPASPLTSPLSTSPSGAGPGAEPSPAQPPYLSLDGLDDLDSPNSPDVVVPPVNIVVERADSGRTPEDGLRKSAKSFRKTGTSKLRGRSSVVNQNGEGKDTGSIFSRPHLQGSDWPPDLEKAFRRHINAELTEYIRKAFKKTPTHTDADTTKAPTDKAPESSTEATTKEAHDSQLGAEPCKPLQREVSLASALPHVLPPDRPILLSPPESPRPSKPLYVPPHLRRASAKAAETGPELAEPSVSNGVAGNDHEAPLPPTVPEQPAIPEQGPLNLPAQDAPRKYVNPFMRKAAERAAAEAAAAEAAAEAAAGAATLPASQSASSTALPSVDAGGNERYGYSVNQGPRASMEDAVDAIANLNGNLNSEFYAVYDGHSGTEAVQFVRRRLPAVISSHPGFGDAEQLDEALRDAFTSTDEELLQHLQAQGQSPTQKNGSSYVLSSGCVGCVAIVRGGRITVANLGDCRAVTCTAGDIVALTVDHRPEVNEGERDRLKDLGVEVSTDGYLHGRIGVSRAFGDWAWDAEEKCRGLLCKPEVTSAEVNADTEFLLLACDGVFEKMTTKEAGQIVRRKLRTSGDAKAAAEAIVQHAVKRNGSDNVSAMVVLFKKPPVDTERAAPRLFGRSRLLEEPKAEEPPAEATALLSAAPSAET